MEANEREPSMRSTFLVSFSFFPLAIRMPSVQQALKTYLSIPDSHETENGEEEPVVDDDSDDDIGPLPPSAEQAGPTKKRRSASFS